jgi:hypothetical protein
MVGVSRLGPAAVSRPKLALTVYVRTVHVHVRVHVRVRVRVPSLGCARRV